MRSMNSLSHCALASALLGALICSTALLGSPVMAAQGVAPAIRIVDRIDESNLVTLKGNTHPAANAKNDRGRVSADLPMTDLVLVLSRSPEQQAAFEKFVAGQYDPASPDFHQWLTPDEVGTKFGPSETDIATISRWLTGHGLSVDQVTKDRMSIRFSGTAAMVESAFHTEMHNLEVNGFSHIGNVTDPQIPAALAPAVVGVKALHNFFPHPLHRLGSQVTRDAESGLWKRPAASGAGASAEAKSGGVRPEFGINVPSNPTSGTIAYTVEDVTPYDFATIYNVLPLWNAGIDGTGQTIAIAGTSNIDPTDVATFRNFFKLPTGNAVNTPIVVNGSPNGEEPLTICTDPGNELTPPPCTIDDLIENSLDVEWSGAVAKNAQIVLVASYAPPNSTIDGLWDSESYIVNNVDNAASPVNGVHIMNVSYGICELGNGTAGNVEYYNLWSQAAAEGLAVFVASGDSGSASCDGGEVAENGLAVSGLASTPYNTAVGGTDFNWCPLTDIYNGQVGTGSPQTCPSSPYWNATNASNGSTAKGYVPEVPWNDSCASSLALGYLQDWANNSTFFGVPGVKDAETACNLALISTGSQIDLSGYLNTVGGGGGASGCVVSDSSGNCTTGATSTGTTNNPDTNLPQGSLTLYQNGWPKPDFQNTSAILGLSTAAGARTIPDISFFSSDGFLSGSAYLICVYDNGSLGSGDEPCTYAVDTEPFASEVGGTSASTPAMAGVMALINQKAGSAQGSPNAELYKLAAQQTYSSCKAESVSAGSTSCYFNDIDTGSNAVPCDYGAFGYLSPGCKPAEILDGSADNVGVLPGYSATTGYDLATGLGSLNVANVVNAWPATVGTAKATVSVTPAPASIASSQSLGVTGTVASSPSGGATPTGTVTLTAGTYSSSMALSNTGTYSFTVPANSLSAGADTINVAYLGDATYGPASGQASVTVTGTGVTFSLTQPAIVVTPASIAPGSSATATVTVSSVGGYAGTVTLTCQLQSTTAASGGDPAPCSGGGEPGVTLNSSTSLGTVVFTVTTSAPVAALAYPKLPGKGRGWEGAGGGAVLALLLFLGVPARRRSWRSMLGVFVLMAALGSLTACGGGGSSTSTPPPQSDPGTTAGAYTYTVQATGNPSVGSISTTFTVTVN